ncbi:hypothetical protein GLAREA_01351 [Glarea lozoyensis ATCC 20868]|uniref:Heterokaryon incompatibility domain-containing protein n=1 Tax=Glarea lozoyensis (strain ATCC 20868 / MF5171) TaxID=1116229 RepID=S3CJN3_GLAL2|nr:uncharacterized protein GLAREA_01351 [Glarea lozoyensis ATCC 20868]EPE25439.1 hypothetical protein GLAREA_01351 [Glarea lozoyensis ATCC 20868]
MPLCEVCQRIDIRSLVLAYHEWVRNTSNEYTTSGDEHIFTSPNTQPHHASFEELRDAAIDGCEFCRLVWGCDDFEVETLPFLCSSPQWPRRWENGPVFLVVDSKFSSKLVLYVVVDPGHLRYVPRRLEICTLKGEEMPLEDKSLLNQLVQDETPQYLGSDVCLSVGTRWLEKCLHEHFECRAKQSLQRILPKRVLDVGESSTDPRLYLSSENEIGNWVALSYVWGGDSDFKLTERSMSDFQTGLPSSSFPSTLRDAVLVTRALGLKYLWIDALCILQDSERDWEIQASLMGDIYKNAILTIAATSTSCVSSGFLNKRETGWNCTLPWRHPDFGETAKSPIVVRHPRNDESRISRSLRAKRGWTFQEHLLSTRILLYSSRQMQWQCSQLAAKEASPDRQTFEYFQELFKSLKNLITETESQTVTIAQNP